MQETEQRGAMRHIIAIAVVIVAGVGVAVFASAPSASTRSEPVGEGAPETSVSGIQVPTPVPGATLLARADIERELVLEVTLRSPQVIRPGGAIAVQVALRNRSSERTHHVVKPGEGSALGWREPHMFYTAKMDEGDGLWTDVPEASVGQCATFDFDWRDDVVALAPGDVLELDSWVDSPDMALALDVPGKARIVLHYAYRPSVDKRSRVQLSGPIAAVPDYELRSAPIEIDIKSDVDVGPASTR